MPETTGKCTHDAPWLIGDYYESRCSKCGKELYFPIGPKTWRIFYSSLAILLAALAGIRFISPLLDGATYWVFISAMMLIGVISALPVIVIAAVAQGNIFASIGRRVRAIDSLQGDRRD